MNRKKSKISSEPAVNLKDSGAGPSNDGELYLERGDHANERSDIVAW